MNLRLFISFFTSSSTICGSYGSFVRVPSLGSWPRRVDRIPSNTTSTTRVSPGRGAAAAGGDPIVSGVIERYGVVLPGAPAGGATYCGAASEGIGPPGGSIGPWAAAVPQAQHANTIAQQALWRINGSLGTPAIVGIFPKLEM
jgi:hypothetical protein